MVWSFVVQGYTGGLDEELRWVWLNPRGRALKQVPGVLQGHREVLRMAQLRRWARRHRQECGELAGRWALAGVAVPARLGEDDPVWRDALAEQGVALGEEPAGDDGLVARVYAHAVTGRRITRVMHEDVAPYRDRVMAYDEWERVEGFRTGIPADTVADADRPFELPFPERALAAWPGREETVLAEADRLSWLALNKAETDRYFKDLEKSGPELLPLFLDAMAERYLCTCAKGLPEAAAAYFGRARKAEREQALVLDQDWLDARYLRFAGAGAVAATALRARAKELSVKGMATPERAAAFRDIVIALAAASGTLGGPYAQLATDVRKVARAAGLDPEEELATVLGEAGIVRRGPAHDDAFWSDALKGRAFDLLCEREPETVGADVLSWRRPDRRTDPALWVDMLERSGALARLCGELPGVPAAEAARWLTDCVFPQHDFVPFDGTLYGIATRLVPRLAVEQIPVEILYEPQPTGPGLRRPLPLDLIDLCLEYGVPLADPPERLLSARMNDLDVRHRPGMRQVWDDPRFGRELRAALHDVLHKTLGHSGYYGPYRPYDKKGWKELHPLFAADEGRELLREWCAQERAALSRGVDLAGLTQLLGRFVHAGVAVEIVLKDADTAAEFAAVDVIGLLMAELPDGADPAHRAELEKLIDGLPPEPVGDILPPRPAVMDVVARLWPGLEDPQSRQAADTLQTAINCRVGLARLVRWFTPAAPQASTAPEVPAAPQASAAPEVPEAAAGPAGDAVAPPFSEGLVSACEGLIALAGSDRPVWTGEGNSHTVEIGVGRSRDPLLSLHAFTALVTLEQAALGDVRPGSAATADAYAAYARLPFVADPEQRGRWRIVWVTARNDREWLPDRGRAFRTPTSVAVVIDFNRRQRTLLEYAPEGDFPVDGPMAAAGAEVVHTELLRPVRPASWYARFAELRQERGPVPARPTLVAPFADRLGVDVVEAVVLLVARPNCAGHQEGPEKRGLTHRSTPWHGDVWQVKDADPHAATRSLQGLLTADEFTEFYDRLLPDDPERLWTDGPDVERAADWWQDRFGAPLPVPRALLPLAGKEFVRPKAEAPAFSGPTRPAKPWWPAPRLAALLGHVASGGRALTSDEGTYESPHPGTADLLGLVRAAAWTAYRTPAGDPLRPAVGATVARLREALDAGPGPLTLFSTRPNHLLNAPARLESLGLEVSTHRALSWRDDREYTRVRHIRVDPAALTGPEDPLLDRLDAYLDGAQPSQWLPGPSGLPGLADLRMLLSPGFAELGAHLTADDGRVTGWEQHPGRSVPRLVEECSMAYGLGADAAALYLMLLALPDPTDRNVKQWTEWRPARFKAAHTELAASGRVIRADRARAGRTLFLPGPWQEAKAPRLPLERSKQQLLPNAREHRSTTHTAVVPHLPIPVLFERAWAQNWGS
ncbi:hypothetical protein [Streptomyces aureus]|uniref:hypothetical protein n=1 Tax=Streptomyces aureus TaxID=193461 RepID=UPI0036802997